MRTCLKATHRPVGTGGCFKALARILCLLPILCNLPGVRSESTEDIGYKEATNIINNNLSGLIVSGADSYYEPTPEYWDSLTAATEDGKTVLHFSDQFPGHTQKQYQNDLCPWYHGRGNLSFCTNDSTLAKTVKAWCDGNLKCEPPKCYEDLYDESVVGQLISQIEGSMAYELAMTAFPAEMAQEAVSYTHLTLPTNREV